MCSLSYSHALIKVSRNLIIIRKNKFFIATVQKTIMLLYMMIAGMIIILYCTVTISSVLKVHMFVLTLLYCFARREYKCIDVARGPGWSPPKEMNQTFDKCWLNYYDKVRLFLINVPVAIAVMYNLQMTICYIHVSCFE